VFGIHPERGLSSLILGEGLLEAFVSPTDIANLSVLTCGPVPPNPAELLHTQGFKTILAQASDKYDRVILDSPPAGVVADAVVISTQVDGTLFVLKTGETSRDAAARAIRTLTDVNARLFGAVLNDLNLEDQKYAQYSYYYAYGYHSGRRSGVVRAADRVA
jgi:capsular exopolysaccharide synthesis family protein